MIKNNLGIFTLRRDNDNGFYIDIITTVKIPKYTHTYSTYSYITDEPLIKPDL